MLTERILMDCDVVRVLSRSSGTSRTKKLFVLVSQSLFCPDARIPDLPCVHSHNTRLLRLASVIVECVYESDWRVFERYFWTHAVSLPVQADETSRVPDL